MLMPKASVTDMSTLVLLARHASHDEVGSVLSGRSAIALSAAGREEARAMARRLAERTPHAVHTSPRRRAQETAEIAAGGAGDIRIVPALDEIDFGGWSGRSFAALEEDPKWQTWNRARSTVRAPGGETMAEATERAVTHIAETAEAMDGQSLLCVTHCDIVRGVVAHMLGLSADNLLRFDVDPASLTTLEVAPWGMRLVSLNERAS